MSSKLYVGNLSYSTTEDALINLFSKAGTVVSVDLIKDRVSGRSKGYAFVLMSTPAEAQKAIDMYDGLSLDDSQISVSSARQREDRVGINNRDNGQSFHPLKRGGDKR